MNNHKIVRKMKFMQDKLIKNFLLKTQSKEKMMNNSTKNKMNSRTHPILNDYLVQDSHVEVSIEKNMKISVD